MSGLTGAVIGGAVVGAGASVYSANKAAGATSDASRAANAELARQYDQTREDFAPYRAAGTAALSKLSRLYGLAQYDQAAERARRPVLMGDTELPPGTLASSPGNKSGSDVTLNGQLIGRVVPGGANGRFIPEAGVDINALWQQSGPATIDGATGLVDDSPAPDMSVFTESPDYQFNLSEGQRAIDRSLAARGRSLSGAGVRAGVRYASGMASTEFGNFYNRLASIAGLGQTATGSTAAAGSNASSQIGANIVGAGNSRASSYMTGAQGVNSAIQGGIGNYALLRYLQPGSA